MRRPKSKKKDLESGMFAEYGMTSPCIGHPPHHPCECDSGVIDSLLSWGTGCVLWNVCSDGGRYRPEECICDTETQFYTIHADEPGYTKKEDPYHYIDPLKPKKNKNMSRNGLNTRRKHRHQ